MKRQDDAKRQYGSDEEIESVALNFERCALSPEEFGHREHLTVALFYLSRSSLEAAHKRIREGIQRFLLHHSEPLNVYHETITLFWLKRLQSLLDDARRSTSLFELFNEILESGNDASLINSYYSKERLATDEARTSWIEPDLRPLDF